MSRLQCLLLALCLLLPATPAAAGEAEELKTMLQAMQQKIEALESKLDALEKKEAEQSAQLAVHSEKPEREESTPDGALDKAKEELADLKTTFDTRFGKIEVHGNLIGYAQSAGGGTFNRAYRGGNLFYNKYYPETASAGMSANLMVNWTPVKDSELYFQLQYANGLGPDVDLRDDKILLASLNKITTDVNRDYQSVVLKYAMLTQYMFDRKLFFTVGKADQETYIDQNVYAGNGYSQFLGMPFNKDPILDQEDDQTPMLAVGFQPTGEYNLTALYNSSSTALAEEKDKKSGWDDIFTTPFFGAQFTWSPKFNERQGNYRFYGWTQTYQHPILGKDINKNYGSEAGWSLGVSFDQAITDKLGLFLRAAHHNENVYTIPWSLAYGASLKGLIPDREDDVIGLGASQQWSNPNRYAGGIEHHFETYYRWAFNKYFFLTPDAQLVVNPQGDADNPAIFSGALRGEFLF